ncbi:MAG: glutamate--tRNA ligase family protein [Oscillospiraceae bacterium]
MSNTTTQDRPVCGRFAPSPSGRMHLGNLWSALLAWLAARSRGGRMVLRLEDLDPDRCTQTWCDQVMRDLEWLGLDWDNEPVYQSRRTQAYRGRLSSGWRSRSWSIPCYCTRAERLAASAPHRSDGSGRV